MNRAVAYIVQPSHQSRITLGFGPNRPFRFVRLNLFRDLLLSVWLVYNMPSMPFTKWVTERVSYIPFLQLLEV